MCIFYLGLLQFYLKVTKLTKDNTLSKQEKQWIKSRNWFVILLFKHGYLWLKCVLFLFYLLFSCIENRFFSYNIFWLWFPLLSPLSSSPSRSSARLSFLRKQTNKHLRNNDNRSHTLCKHRNSIKHKTRGHNGYTKDL